MNSMYLDQIHSTYHHHHLVLLPILPSPPQLRFFFPWVQLVLPTCACVEGHHWNMGNPPGTNHWRKPTLSFPQQPWPASSSSARGGASCALLPPCWDVTGLILCMQPQLLCGHECNGNVLSREHWLWPLFTSYCFHLSTPFFSMFIKPWRGEGVNIDVQWGLSPPHWLLLWTHGQLWVSLYWTLTHCTVKLVWWGVRDALIDGYRNSYLGGGLMLCPFSKIIVVNSLLRSTTSSKHYWSKECIPNSHRIHTKTLCCFQIGNKSLHIFLQLWCT